MRGMSSRRSNRSGAALESCSSSCSKRRGDGKDGTFATDGFVLATDVDVRVSGKVHHRLEHEDDDEHEHDFRADDGAKSGSPPPGLD